MNQQFISTQQETKNNEEMLFEFDINDFNENKAEDLAVFTKTKAININLIEEFIQLKFKWEEIFFYLFE